MSRALSPVLRARNVLPGLGVVAILALVAMALGAASGLKALNPVVVALALGIAVRAALGPATSLRPGIGVAVRPVLRAAVVLLGLQVTPAELLNLGAGALALAAVLVVATTFFTLWLGALLGVDRPLSLLIGSGTAICGASAIVAANQVARGKEEDVAYALAVVTLCGTAALLILPVLAEPLGLDARAYGLWAGAAVHEVVQAVGAAAAGGPEATQAGTVMKLARVVLLAPTVLALAWWAAASAKSAGARESPAEARAAVPWFAFGFIALVLLRGTGLVPDAAVAASRALVPPMLAMSVAALGLSTDLRALGARGGAPLLLGIIGSVFLGLLALVGVGLVA